MKFQNVFSDKVNVRGPGQKGLIDIWWLIVDGAVGDGISERCWNADVVHQRIEPNIGDIIPIEGKGNAPIQTVGRAGDAEILKDIVLQKAQYFVTARLRIN